MVDRRLVGVVLVVCSGAMACAEGYVDAPEVAPTRDALAASQSFLVSFSGGAIPANADALVRSAGGTIAARYTNVGIVLARSGSAGFAASLRATAGVDAVAAANAVHSAIDIVDATATRRTRHPQPSAGDDPLSFRQWNMKQIRAPQARAISGGKPSVLVGVLDSGIDITHPDMAGQVDASASVSCVGGIPNTDPAIWADDIIGHGTHVSGVIAAKKNGVGVVGVAPGVRLAAVKVAIDDLNDPLFGFVFADAFVCAVDWAIGHKFDLMNASLTVDPFMGSLNSLFCDDNPDHVATAKMIRRAVAEAGRKKIALVAATGNAFLDLANQAGAAPGSSCHALPVQLPRVIGVSAVGFTRQLAFYSNYGFGAVDLTAPGGDQLFTDPAVTDTEASGQVISSLPPSSLFFQLAAQWNGQVTDCSSGTCATYAYLQGTSAAAPHVTGVAALAISRFGRLAPEVLLGFLSLTAKGLPCPDGPYDPGDSGAPATCKGPALYNNFYGAGEVDALAVVR